MGGGGDKCLLYKSNSKSNYFDAIRFSHKDLYIYLPDMLSRNMKNIRIFYLKIFIFLVVKFSVYLNRCVFVMERGFTYNIHNIIRHPQVNLVKIQFGEESVSHANIRSL